MSRPESLAAHVHDWIDTEGPNRICRCGHIEPIPAGDLALGRAARLNPKRLILGNATEWLDFLDERFAAEETEDWQFAYKRTSSVEYAARQARQAVRDLRYRIEKFDQAVRDA